MPVAEWGQVAVWAWAALIAAVIGYELYALWDHAVRTPPLTHVVIQYVPWWVALPVLGWLCVHFLIRYLK